MILDVLVSLAYQNDDYELSGFDMKRQVLGKNGHKESFFGHFKLEVGDLNRFETLGELIKCIYNMVYYYNNKQIYSVLKTIPSEKN